MYQVPLDFIVICATLCVEIDMGGGTKMTKIADSFCGYINVDNDTFAYSVSHQTVTLLPAHEKDAERHMILDRFLARNTGSPGFLYGTEAQTQIAIFCNGRFNTGFLRLNTSATFSTPLIIKAVGNANGFYNKLTEDWNSFHAITFWGHNINSVYNPAVMVDDSKDDNVSTVKLHPRSEYTHSTSFEIDNEKVVLTISAFNAGKNHVPEKASAYSLGELNSCICLSFENAQPFDRIEKYYRIIKNLIAILTVQSNVNFEISLSQRIADNNFYESAVCKVFDHYENYALKKYHEVVQISEIFDCLPALINVLSDNRVDALLSLLPEDNRRVHRITITNVQDLCTALEVAYNWSDRHKAKDSLIEELKAKIKDTISEFTNSHPELDVSTETTLPSAFQYLDYTLKQKILTLYSENHDIVDAITSKWGMPQVNETSIGKFVKLRNSKTHTGIAKMDDAAQLYIPLRALAYVCLFRYIGLPYEAVKCIIQKVFL